MTWQEVGGRNNPVPWVQYEGADEEYFSKLERSRVSHFERKHGEMAIKVTALKPESIFSATLDSKISVRLVNPKRKCQLIKTYRLMDLSRGNTKNKAFLLEPYCFRTLQLLKCRTEECEATLNAR
ncbi:hypothetical protein CEXT_719151 [Caerostris extrusa]|uniref:Uncharacterized protein n=1 Tax=Caerostris extrusa TaxID=172846 RepID=A0AAV4MVS1_CAEEX|nr:hypothetical protein CEXT_719151 [Caerostris extrusa]